MARGKFIVLYGINNLGKTTQIERIIKYLATKNIKSRYIKYPVYSNRSGNVINDYLRHGLKLSIEEFQTFCVINKYEFANELDAILDSGVWVIAEDYTLTTIAWGMAGGLKRSWFDNFDLNLLKPDLAILMDGERFLQSKEKGHKHESNKDLTENSRKYHLKLAKKENIPVINANQDIEKVTNDIVKLIKIR
jgi:thymidylate kinase